MYLTLLGEQQPCYPAGVSQGSSRQQDEDLQRQLQQLKLVIAQLEERIKRQGNVRISSLYYTYRGFVGNIWYLILGSCTDETATQVTQDNAPCSSSYIQKQVYHILPHS